jgi:hypothetical protein
MTKQVLIGFIRLKVLAAFVTIKALALLSVALAAHQKESSLTKIFQRWDAQWYRRIAQDGYGYIATTPDGRTLSDYAFFPLYPYLERWVHKFTSLSYINSGLLISAISSVIAALGIYLVIERTIGSKIAFYTVILWAALPIAAVQTLAYSESLFTALAAWGLYYALKRQWIAAGLFAFFAGLTRPTSIAIILAVMVAVLIELQKRRRDKNALIALLIAPLGMIGYIYWVGTQLDGWNSYFKVTEGWGNGIDGGRAFAAWITNFFHEGQPITGLVVLAAITLLMVLLWGLWRKSVPAPILVYAFTLVLISLATSGYFGSKPRYLLPAFPLLIPIAIYISKRRRGNQKLILASTIMTSLIYSAIWLTGNGPL